MPLTISPTMDLPASIRAVTPEHQFWMPCRGFHLRIGPLGLVLLGLLTLFICSQFALHDTIPTTATALFRTEMTRPSSPENRAAEAANRDAIRAPLRFYRGCGVLLVVTGTAILAIQSIR